MSKAKAGHLYRAARRNADRPNPKDQVEKHSPPHSNPKPAPEASDAK